MSDLLTTVVQIGSLTGVAFTVGTTIATRTLPWLRTKITGRMVTRRLGSIYTKEEAEEAVRHYVEPMCQNLDPARAEEPRADLRREKLFATIDRALENPAEHRYFFFLADSGMGKSSALINYYARHLRRLRRRGFEISVVPLGMHDADARIEAIPDKRRTVLFLDAFDEDIQAIVDYAERLRALLWATRDFRTVLLACRSQFFNKDEEIPRRTGVPRLGARSAGKPAEYMFHRIYLSPFSDTEIKAYLKKRYPFWRSKVRRQAAAIISRAPNLAVRPMLLTHVDVLIQGERRVRCSAELYEEMVEAWLLREEGVGRSRDHLREFSELLAVDLYMNREERGAERIPRAAVDFLARAWDIPIESWALTGRSLLNRDAEGNYKFSHRSIMEFLFVRRVAAGRFTPPLDLAWTDQMKRFLEEGIRYNLPWLGPELKRANKGLSGGFGFSFAAGFIEKLLAPLETVRAYGHLDGGAEPWVIRFEGGLALPVRKDASLAEIAKETLSAMSFERYRHIVGDADGLSCAVVRADYRVAVFICSDVDHILRFLPVIQPLLSDFAIVGGVDLVMRHSTRDTQKRLRRGRA